MAKTLHRQFGVDLWHEFIQAGLEEDYTPFSIQRQAGSFGWCGLPGKNGHILAMTSEEELYTIPGVVDITMHHKIGERVSGKRSSVFYNGVLYFHATDINDIQRIYRAVNEIYQVQVE